ncbi:MAG: sulfotransferase [Leptospirillia bacterium]
MANRAILITGSQRSGTTMLNLAMDSHPDVRGIDEVHFNRAQLGEYLSEPEYGPWVCFKLPVEATNLPLIRQIKGVKVLWALRDPRAVTASMIKLKLVLRGQKVPWAAHPYGGMQELTTWVNTFKNVPPDLVGTMNWFAERMTTPPGEWPPDLLTTGAALCWRLKNELLKLYDRAGIDYRVVVYEKLVTRPEEELRSIFKYLGLDWHDDVLRHHELHEGQSVGDTDSERAIDTTSMDKWKKQLEQPQLELIRKICGPLAKDLGYEL